VTWFHCEILDELVLGGYSFVTPALHQGVVALFLHSHGLISMFDVLLDLFMDMLDMSIELPVSP
jgi:hypothetical protein